MIDESHIINPYVQYTFFGGEKIKICAHAMPIKDDAHNTPHAHKKHLTNIQMISQQLLTFDIHKVRRTLSAAACQCPNEHDDDDESKSRNSSSSRKRTKCDDHYCCYDCYGTHPNQGGGERIPPLEKFGHKVHWIPGLHYTAQELEPYRLVGDEELDYILNLELDSPEQEEHSSSSEGQDGIIGGGGGGGSSSTLGGSLCDSDGDNKSIIRTCPNSLDGRFSNTIQACATFYHQHYCEDMITRKTNHKDTAGDEEIPSINTKKDNLPLGFSRPNYQPKQMAMWKFYHHYHNLIPSWVDWEQIQRGIDVFILYAPVAGQALFYLSLVPGFSIPKIAKVLQQTRYLAPPSTAQQVKNRLMDTGGFLTSVVTADSTSSCSSPSSLSKDCRPASCLRPGGKGWTMALQVRLLHAKVRRSILKQGRNRQQQKQQSHRPLLEPWNVKECGIPINQEDMAATLLAFSINVIMGIEFVAGRPLSRENERDYLALWRYIGWLLGIRSREDKVVVVIQDTAAHEEHPPPSALPPLDPCGPKLQGDGKEYHAILHAHASLESFILHLMHPNQSSIEIAHHLLQMGGGGSGAGGGGRGSGGIHSRTAVKNFAFLYRSFMCRRYIGNELAHALELPKPNHGGIQSMIAYWMTWMVLMLLRMYTLLTMQSLWFQKFVYSRHVNLLMKFETIWRRNHKERMVTAEQSINLETKDQVKDSSSMKSPSPSSSPGRKVSGTGANHHNGDDAESFCPFGLVMPPTTKTTTNNNNEVNVLVEDHVKMD
jgi:hypothetical protein